MQIQAAVDGVPLLEGDGAGVGWVGSGEQIIGREEPMGYRVVVDYDLCESNAICMQVAPDVFEVRDDDFLYLLNETPGDEARERVNESVQRCPKQAISVAEE